MPGGVVVCPVVCQRVSACPACGEGEGEGKWALSGVCVVCVSAGPRCLGHGGKPWAWCPGHGGKLGPWPRLALVLVHGWTIWGKAGEYWVCLVGGGGLGSGAGGRKNGARSLPYSPSLPLRPSPHHSRLFPLIRASSGRSPLLVDMVHFSALTGFPLGDSPGSVPVWARKNPGFLIRGKWVSMG